MQVSHHLVVLLCCWILGYITYGCTNRKQYLLLTAKMLFETWACHWHVCEIYHFMRFLNLQWLLFQVGFGFIRVGEGVLVPSQEDRDDSKHKITVCMLVKRTIEYCDWMAAVTSGLSPLSECFDIDIDHSKVSIWHAQHTSLFFPPPPQSSLEVWIVYHEYYGFTAMIDNNQILILLFLFQYHWSGENRVLHVVCSQNQWF